MLINPKSLLPIFGAQLGVASYQVWAGGDHPTQNNNWHSTAPAAADESTGKADCATDADSATDAD